MRHFLYAVVAIVLALIVLVILIHPDYDLDDTTLEQVVAGVWLTLMLLLTLLRRLAILPLSSFGGLAVLAPALTRQHSRPESVSLRC